MRAGCDREVLVRNGEGGGWDNQLQMILLMVITQKTSLPWGEGSQKG